MRRTCSACSRCSWPSSRPRWPPARTAGCTRAAAPRTCPAWMPTARWSSADATLAAAQAQVSRDQIQLFLALGGGWNADAVAAAHGDEVSHGAAGPPGVAVFGQDLPGRAGRAVHRPGRQPVAPVLGDGHRLHRDPADARPHPRQGRVPHPRHADRRRGHAVDAAAPGGNAAAAERGDVAVVVRPACSSPCSTVARAATRSCWPATPPPSSASRR